MSSSLVASPSSSAPTTSAERVEADSTAVVPPSERPRAELALKSAFLGSRRRNTAASPPSKRAKLVDGTLWEQTSKHQEEHDEFEEKYRPERFPEYERSASWSVYEFASAGLNLYYDMYNNGFCNTDSAMIRKVFDLDIFKVSLGRYYRRAHDGKPCKIEKLIETRLDELVLAAVVAGRESKVVS